VPPFGNLFGLRTIYDESLLGVESVNFNAGSHTDSVAMSRADLIRIGGGEVAAYSKNQATPIHEGQSPTGS
jgi:prolyl-tRNA editing enzyme YbaK/EbsC (Cys-tRNA(Pro) deacylase)